MEIAHEHPEVIAIYETIEAARETRDGRPATVASGAPAASAATNSIGSGSPERQPTG